MDTQQKEGAVSGKKPRMMNLELLRCIAMMMVVVLHFLGKGNLLGSLGQDEMNMTRWTAWILESFAIVAVNVYMLISGYFLSESGFKLSRLLNILIQVWTYSVVFGLLGVVLGFVPAEEFNVYYLLQLVFPISMNHYWFLTAYVFLYLLLPLVGTAVKQMDKKQMQLTITLLLLAFSVMKSVLPVRITTDGKGYDFLWYLCVFMVAAYIRKFGLQILEKKGVAILLYVGASMLAFGEIAALYMVYQKSGKLLGLLSISHEYNHIFPLLAAVGLFMAFLRMQVAGGFGKLVGKIAPLTLGVYLLHENLGMRYAWQSWFGAEEICSVSGLLLGTFAAAVVVFAVGILTEAIRSMVMKGLHSVLMHCGPYEKLIEKITAADALFGKKAAVKENE